MDTVVAELVNFFQAMKSGSLFHYLILLALVLIGLAAAVAYQRVVIKRLHTASKATQENSKTIAADLRERALEVKKLDEGLRKHELEVNERKQQQQQVLKRSQRALKGSVSRIVMIGLKDLQQKPDEAALNSQEPRRKRVPNNGDLEKLPQPFDATNMPLNDSALFPLRFTGVHGPAGLVSA